MNYSAFINVICNKTINCFNIIIGDNNNVTFDNAGSTTVCKSFPFIININFNSKKGLIFYGVLMILLDLIWMACILCSNIVAFLIALTLIPFLYFFIGKYYLKQKEDKKHLKIHNVLISLITMSILLFVMICIFSSLIGDSVLILGCILMIFNLLVSPSLCINALGGSKVLDFVMGIFIKYSET